MSAGDFDVIVVGGGPAGSACATVLARAGHTVALLEKSRFPREKICGDTLNPRSWPLLKDLGVDTELRHAPLRTVSALRVFNRRGHSACSRTDPREDEPLAAVRRSVFDTILLRHAARAGARVFEETTAGELELGESILLGARTPQGAWRASCRFLVGADGRNSKIARSLLPQKEQSGDSRIGLQWYTASHEHLDDEIHLYLLPFGYFGIVNVEPEAANLAMVLDTRRSVSGARDIRGLIQEMRRGNRAIDRNLGDLTPASPVQTTSPITPPRMRRGTEQIMLVGDAGRIVEPFTGEGMYFALQDGMAAAAALCERLKRGDTLTRKPAPHFWVNRAVSQVLRHHTVADAAVSLGAALPGLTKMAARAVAGI